MAPKKARNTKVAVAPAAASKKKAKTTSAAAAPATASMKKKAPVVVISSGSAADDEGQKKRRQLDRRDTEEAVERYKQRKLNHIPEGRLLTVRNAEGKTVDQHITDEIKSKRQSQGRLASAFLVSIYDQFNLYGDQFDDLPQPDGSRINPDLEAAMEAAHDDNPVKKSIKPMLNLLARKEQCDEMNFTALLKSSSPGPLLVVKDAVRIQVAVFEWIAATKSHLKFPKSRQLSSFPVSSSRRSCRVEST